MSTKPSEKADETPAASIPAGSGTLPPTADPAGAILKPAKPAAVPSPAYRPDKEIDVLMIEWKEVRETLRYFGNKRFAQLTVFIAANGFMINAYFGKDNPMPGLWGGIFGAILAVVFLLHEISSVSYFKRFAERGVAIEGELGIVRMISNRPRKDLGTKATYTLYVVTLVAWLAIIWFDLINVRPTSLHPQWAADLWQRWKNW